jgi:peptidoglycan hydrolase CwlO-like protein
MSKFWKAVIILAIVVIVLYAVSLFVPQVKGIADAMKGSKVPWWIAGLLAPIVFVFKKIGEGFQRLLGTGATEEEIAQKNQAIEAKLAQLENDVRQLDEWRKTEIEQRTKRIDELNQNIQSMEGRAGVLDQSISGLTQRKEQLQGAIQVDPDIIE